MKTLFLTLIATALGLMTMAQVGTIENINVQQRTDGTGMVDISFYLTGLGTAQYNITIEASFNSGETYQPIGSQYLSGNLNQLSPPDTVTIVWNGLGSHPDVFSEKAILRITADLVGNVDGQTGSVTDVDGNVYRTVIIGKQEWMAENLRVTRDPNGKNITRYCYDNNTTNCNIYGGMYTWNTVMNGMSSSTSNPSNVQGICPAGWHVPSDSEWFELVNYMDAKGFPNEMNNTKGVGNALKSCRQQSSPLGGACATSVHPRWDSDEVHFGRDELGFSALGGGVRLTNGSFGGMGNVANIWTSTEGDAANAWHWRLHNWVGSIWHFNETKGYGAYIRCVRDK